MNDKICPLCGGKECGSSIIDSIYTSFKCKTIDRTVIIGSTVLNESDITKRKLLNLVFEYVLRKPFCNSYPWRFIYNDSYTITDTESNCYINLADVHYPNTISEKCDRVLLNLAYIFPEYSDKFIPALICDRAVFPESKQEEERKGFLSVLCDLGYLKVEDGDIFSISALGWQRIELLTRGEYSLRQGFIAMSFSPKVEYIGESIKSAIMNCDYSPMIIKDKEHNHQIVPEILYEIDRSKFLVMDVTLPNYGAYYEAGYALGKGKEVIISCSKEAFDNPDQRPHFDILQKSLVVWEDEDDLKEKLQKRIKATVKE